MISFHAQVWKHYGINRKNNIDMGNQNQGFYYLSNDCIDLSRYKFEQHRGSIFVGIANPHCFHAIPLGTQFSRIYLMDINPLQVSHLKFMIECIKTSSDRMSFIRKFLKIDFPEGLDPSKENVWKKSTWSGDPIGEITDRGIMFEARDSFGGIVSHRLTLFDDVGDPGCFWLGLNRGWLLSEKTFNTVKGMCDNITLFEDDIIGYYTRNWDKLRYHQVVLWISNLLSPWFYDTIPSIREFWSRLDKHLDPKLPRDEIDVKVVFDTRTHVDVDSRFIGGKPMSAHFKAFREVVEELKGKTLEVPGINRWIEEDNWKSKLPNTRYMKPSDLKICAGADTIFLHGMMSHGMSETDFLHIFKTAVKLAKRRVLVLEFNSRTSDVIDGQGKSWNDLVGICGKPNKTVECRGNSGDVRNWLLVYERKI